MSYAMSVTVTQLVESDYLRRGDSLVAVTDGRATGAVTENGIMIGGKVYPSPEGTTGDSPVDGWDFWVSLRTGETLSEIRNRYALEN